MSWNPDVPQSRRIPTTKKNDGRPVPQPTHVVLHITGTDDFEKAKNTYLTSVSPHYVVDKAGLVYQFVEEENQAWHAGIRKETQMLYAEPPSTWRKFVFYFDFDKSYPADAVYLDGDLKPVAKKSAVFVARADGSEWPKYRIFPHALGRQRRAGQLRGQQAAERLLDRHRDAVVRRRYAVAGGLHRGDVRIAAQSGRRHLHALRNSHAERAGRRARGRQPDPALRMGSEPGVRLDSGVGVAEGERRRSRPMALRRPAAS